MSRLSAQFRMVRQMVGPVHLAGLTLGQWVALLRRNQWRVDPAFWPRAVLATLGATATSLLRPVDQWLFDGDACDQDLVEHPVFVLGMARSGTTMLFNLLARNPHFGYPSRMDAFYPHTFRTLHRLGIPRLLSLIPGQSRSLDNVRVTWLSPEEDILALCVLAGTGERLSAAFPRSDYRRLSAEEWRRQIRTYSRRLVQVYRRHLLFKSPEHLARIPEILAEFPQARFVMIFRNPTTHYHSFLGLRRTSNRIWGSLQWPGPEPPTMWLDVALHNLKFYFQHRTLIPPENLTEVRYEDVAARQTEVLQAIHHHLRIPEPAEYPPVEPYTRNQYPEMDPKLMSQIRSAYAELYDRGYYT
jgi:hypothetical protein